MNRPRIAVIDDETIVCRRLSQTLVKDEMTVETFTTGKAFLARLAEYDFDVVVSDLRLPDLSGMDLLAAVKKHRPESEVIMITGYGSIDSAIEAIKAGAYHYVTKPVKLEEIRMLIRGALDKIAMRLENLRLREALQDDDGLGSIIGASRAMQDLFSIIRKVAPVDCNVLLQGESGTGKALAARAIHKLSPRKTKPFVSFNCGGFTDELIASELFGYEKGAFTGASATKIGLLESACGGTVFLDEIGEMPLTMQVKLLHVLQERRILRVGGTRPIDLDIRIVAATNKDLKLEVADNHFREDLYFRLNVVTIHLPPLSERDDDIALLAMHFVKKYSLAFHKTVSVIEPSAMAVLTSYSYPGNVRELENIIERAVALTDCDGVRLQDLPKDMQELEVDTVKGEGLLNMQELERRHLAKVLEKTGYNKSLAAQILNIPRTTLWRKLKQYNLD